MKNIFKVNYLKQCLLITTFIISTNDSYALAPFNASTDQSALQNKISELQAELTKEQATTQQIKTDNTRIQSQISTLQQSNLAATNALAQEKKTYAEKLETHTNTVQNLQKQIQQYLDQIQQLKADLLKAQKNTGGSGNSSEEVVSLKQEITRLQEKLIELNPQAAQDAFTIAPYENPDNFIHKIIIKPLENVTLAARDQAIHKINTAADNLAARIVNGYVPLPPLLPAIRMGNMIQRRTIATTLTNLKDSIQDPNNLERNFYNASQQLVAREGQLKVLPADGTDADYDMLLAGIQELTQVFPLLETYTEQENLKQVQEQILHDLNAAQAIDNFADRIISNAVKELKDLIDPTKTPKMEPDAGGIGTLNPDRKAIKEFVNTVLSLISSGNYNDAYVLLFDKKIINANILARLGFKPVIRVINPLAEQEFIDAAGQLNAANIHLPRANDKQILDKIKTFITSAINTKNGNPLQLDPLEKRHFQEEVDKFFNSQFNNGISIPAITKFKKAYMALRDNKVSESILDILHETYFAPYHQEFQKLSPSVQQLHLLRHGNKRFMDAWKIIKTPLGDPKPKAAANQKIFQEILKIANPIALEKSERANFSKNLTQLAMLKDNEFSGTPEAIENLKFSLFGSYEQMKASAFTVHTYANPPLVPTSE